ncbi:hypothetical protein [Pantoea sp. ME81]|uniref:hypothetical protein n=1 Tax=Pantoea sp. ME81 TaxID=2743935 RepID=UPI0015F4EA84|nr:hypothetical protein [Pantoea sp. ME81]
MTILILFGIGYNSVWLQSGELKAPFQAALRLTAWMIFFLAQVYVIYSACLRRLERIFTAEEMTTLIYPAFLPGQSELKRFTL